MANNDISKEDFVNMCGSKYVVQQTAGRLWDTEQIRELGFSIQAYKHKHRQDGKGNVFVFLLKGPDGGASEDKDKIIKALEDLLKALGDLGFGDTGPPVYHDNECVIILTEIGPQKCNCTSKFFEGETKWHCVDTVRKSSAWGCTFYEKDKGRG